MADNVKPAHTPGPWEWIPSDVYGYIALLGDDGTKEVLAPSGKNDGDYPIVWMSEEMSAADTRLIAAAPDMLAALTECLPLFDMVMALDDQASNALGQAENLIRAAIAKATGALE